VSLEPDVLDGLHKTEKTALEKPIISMLCLDNTLLDVAEGSVDKQ
jgi:hypothetical protein